MVQSQDKDIEIERLKTTCYSLNNKVSLVEDLQRETETLKRRLAESEAIRGMQKAEIVNYEKQVQEYEKNRQEWEEVRQDYEQNRLDYEKNRLEYERERQEMEKAR